MDERPALKMKGRGLGDSTVSYFEATLLATKQPCSRLLTPIPLHWYREEKTQLNGLRLREKTGRTRSPIMVTGKR